MSILAVREHSSRRSCPSRPYWMLVTVLGSWLGLICGPLLAQTNHSAAVRAAMGRILTEDRALQSAYAVCERAAGLPDDQRLMLLSNYVLPGADHDTLRLDFEMMPADPSPGANSATGEVNRGIASPALELIRVAERMGRLGELHQRLTAWKPTTHEARKRAAAMLVGIACAQRDFSTAENHLSELLSLGKVPGARGEYPAETFAGWVSAEHEVLHPLTRDLLAPLVASIRVFETGRTKRWERAVLDKIQALQLPPSAAPGTAAMWVSTSRRLCETRGHGYPSSRWELQPGKVIHASGHDHDFLCFRSPLTGQFSVEADTNTFNFREIQLGYGGLWAGANWDGKSVTRGNLHGELPLVPIDPPFTRMNDWMRVRIDVQADELKHYVNGRLIESRPLSESHDAWLFVHSLWYRNGTVANLRITGQPVIPEVVALLAPELHGWNAYYGGTVGGARSNWRTTGPTDTGSASSPTTELVSDRRVNLAGTFSEDLLQYHRPMLEDGTIEYEFFYEPGQTLVHPALDRLCLILGQDGVDIHWATDGPHDRTQVAPDNLARNTSHRAGANPIPLREGQWNHAALTIDQDTVHLNLNGERVFSRPIEAQNLRTFGLFHWSEQTAVRVRNMTWRGNWPKKLPTLEQQYLADLSLETALGDRTQLESVLQHDFRNPLPPHLLSLLGDNWQDHIVQRDDGLQITRPGGHYVAYLVMCPAILEGDFDIIAEFDQFHPQAVAGGEGTLELLVTLNDERASEHHIYRKCFVFEDRQEQVTQAAIFERRGQDTQFGFLEAPAEEATAGRLRVVRRGTTIYSLIAEQNSPNYRLVHRETVTRDSARFRIQVCHHKEGQTDVLLKSLDVRAEGFSGVPKRSLKTLAELDAERLQLSQKKVWDFRSAKANVPSQGFSEMKLYGQPLGVYSHELTGLRLDVPGSDNWTAAGLLTIPQIEGDFDVELALDVLAIEPCSPNSESCVLLQTEFPQDGNGAVETKFSIHPQGTKRAETQIRRRRADGQFDHEEIVSVPSPDAKILRLARRGEVVYQVFQNSVQAAPVILGALAVGRGPVSAGGLKTLVHTGGAGRMTSIRFRSMTLWADKLIE